MRIMLIFFQVLILVLACNVKRSYSQELNSTLHFTEYGVPFAFIGETITLTCRTEMSNSIGWSSSEYIGVNRLNFASVEPDGTTRPPTDSGAIAQLVSSTRVDGTVILVSQLQIIVQSEYQIAFISCHNIGIDAVSTTSFRIAVNTSVTCDVPAVCPGERFLCSCTTAYSDFLAWSIINDSGELVYHSGHLPQLKPRRIMSNSSISAEISSISVSNEVVVLKSELSLPFLLESRYIILRCENIEDHDSYSAILPVSRKCSSSATISTTTIDELTNVTQTASPPTFPDVSSRSTIVVAAVLITLATVLFVGILLLLVCFLHGNKHISKSYSNTNAKLATWTRKPTRIEEDCSNNTDKCTSIDKDLNAMQTSSMGREADKAQESDKQTGMSNPLVVVHMLTQEMAVPTRKPVAIEEDCSNNAEVYISTNKDPTIMQTCFVCHEGDEAQESNEIAEISKPSMEECMGKQETVIPQCETGDHPRESATRSVEMMEYTWSSPVETFDKRLDKLSSAEKIRILRKEIDQLTKQLSELKLKLAESQKRETEMKSQVEEAQNKEKMADKQIRELKLKVSVYEQQLKEKIPVIIDGTSGTNEDCTSVANEDSQEANVVWKRDRLLVAHTGN